MTSISPEVTSTSSNNLTVVLDGSCNHVLSVALGCEPHGYAHLWGWACSLCWQQFLYDDLDEMCEREVRA